MGDAPSSAVTSSTSQRRDRTWTSLPWSGARSGRASVMGKAVESGHALDVARRVARLTRRPSDCHTLVTSQLHGLILCSHLAFR